MMSMWWGSADKNLSICAWSISWTVLDILYDSFYFCRDAFQIECLSCKHSLVPYVLAILQRLPPRGVRPIPDPSWCSLQMLDQSRG